LSKKGKSRTEKILPLKQGDKEISSRLEPPPSGFLTQR
jgi:hypothetical protein